MAAAMSEAALADLHSLPNDCPVKLLDCQAPFAGLSAKERLYAHYVCAASFEGAKICLIQTSSESPVIFELILTAFRGQDAGEAQTAAVAAGLTAEEAKAVVVYCAAFLSNYGNYASFGDTKFVPRVAADKFWKFIQATAAYGDADKKASLDDLWSKCSEAMFSLSAKVRSLGFGDEGISTYYSANCTREDAKTVQAVMDAKGISGYNTRLFKTGEGEFELRVASTVAGEQLLQNEGADGGWKTIKVVRGDYAPLMQRVVDNLAEAVKHAADEGQASMLTAYIKSFSEGSIDDHKDGSRHWIRDKGPNVESYIGFIETYQDPSGVRGEWEGFAAVVNKEISAMFQNLVDSAADLIALLPWGSAFEKDKFLRPDFTSLEVVGYGSSGIPAGINIPNYDDIRQDEGFKNVSLGNVLRASLSFPKGERVTFLCDADQELYKTTVSESFDVQVGLHELLGHGSGKLLRQNEDGSFNFDKATAVNPLDKSPVESWYSPTQSYDAVFGSISSSLEECRAECVGLYLCGNKDVLKIYGKDETRGPEVTYINWLNMVRAGVLALQYYTPGKGTSGWGQAHMMARYAILQVLLEAGDDFVAVERGEAEQAGGKGSFVRLDKTKIATTGMKAIGEFLTKIQVYKATADTGKGVAMYQRYTAVSDAMLSLRQEVLQNRKPRRMFVQQVTRVNAAGTDVELTSYEPSAEAVLASNADRYPAADPQLLALWAKDAAAHSIRSG